MILLLSFTVLKFSDKQPNIFLLLSFSYTVLKTNYQTYFHFKKYRIKNIIFFFWKESKKHQLKNNTKLITSLDSLYGGSSNTGMPSSLPWSMIWIISTPSAAATMGMAVSSSWFMMLASSGHSCCEWRIPPSRVFEKSFLLLFLWFVWIN